MIKKVCFIYFKKEIKILIKMHKFVFLMRGQNFVKIGINTMARAHIELQMLKRESAVLDLQYLCHHLKTNNYLLRVFMIFILVVFYHRFEFGVLKVPNQLFAFLTSISLLNLLRRNLSINYSLFIFNVKYINIFINVFKIKKK